MATTGDSIGPWTLGERLGVGGNATVWRASRDGGEEVALKLINSTRLSMSRTAASSRKSSFTPTLNPR
jgi:hypothetical protein